MSFFRAITRRKALEDIYDEEFWLLFRTEVARIIAPLFSSSFEAGVDAAVRSIERAARLNPATAAEQVIELDAAMIETAAERYVRSYTSEWLLQFEQTTQEALREAVLIAQRDGLGVDYVIERAAPLFGRERASVVAVTETTRLVGQGAVETYKAAGLQEWEWQTVNDSWVCQICISRLNQRYPVAENFVPAHPRCRCFPRPVTSLSIVVR